MVTRPKRRVTRSGLSARELTLAKRVLIPRGTRVIRPLKMNAKITQMGLSRSVLSKLSPSARQLTKKDLILLTEGKSNALINRLSVNDINNIRKGFLDELKKGGSENMDIYCCCCPCCCATAVIEPVESIA